MRSLNLAEASKLMAGCQLEARFPLGSRERNSPARTAWDFGEWSAPADMVKQSNPMLTFSLGFDRLLDF